LIKVPTIEDFKNDWSAHDPKFTNRLGQRAYTVGNKLFLEKPVSNPVEVVEVGYFEGEGENRKLIIGDIPEGFVIGLNTIYEGDEFHWTSNSTSLPTFN